MIIYVLLSFLYIRFIFGGPQDNWINTNNHQKITIPKTKSDCLEKDGVWKKQGPEPFETCNIKATDRGSICHDNNECQGWCQVDLKKNIKYGQCSVWVVELGCFGMIKNKKPQVICID